MDNLGLDRTETETGPIVLFGLGLISMIQVSVRSYSTSRTIGSVSVSVLDVWTDGLWHDSVLKSSS